MKLAIIIPALNEAKTIEWVISRIPKTINGVNETDVIVVNDGSTDNTVSIATALGAHVVSHRHPRGVGAAFHTGIRTALERGADYIVNLDGDGQFNPEDIPKILEPLQSGTAEFVTATRFGVKQYEPVMPGIKRWGNARMVQIINFLTGKNFTDVSCGFRGYTRETALKISLFGHFTYTHETFIDLAHKDVPMTEVPLIVRGEREHGKSRVASNLWKFGLKSATIIFRSARDYKPFYFFGVPGLIVLGFGVLTGIFLLTHYLNTGQTSPYRSLVTVSGILIIVGFLMFLLSMLADMQHRNRIILEDIRYLTRKRAYRQN